MCSWLRVSRSGFYEWRGRSESATAQRREVLKRAVTISFEESDGTYGDITYIQTWQEWLYPAAVIDCHAKAVIGWAMEDNYKTPLITADITMTARNSALDPDAIFHTDRGSKCTSRTFAEALRS